MRILLVNDYGTPAGGAEVQMLLLRDELRARGHDARLFTSRAAPPGEEASSEYRCAGTLGAGRTLLQVMNPWAVGNLRRTLADFRPDVVHLGMFLTQLSPALLTALRSVPTLYHALWYRAICPTGTKLLPDGSACRSRAGRVCWRSGCVSTAAWLPLMAQARMCQAWRGAIDLVVPTSQAVRDQLRAAGIATTEPVGHGTPEVPARPPLGGAPTVVFAARLVPEKGGDILIRAFARAAAEVADARLLIAGEGPARREMEALAKTLGIAGQVTFLGQLPRAGMEHRFAEGWVQAVPSVWAEPFGLVAIEAMMRGTAVVASDTGGLTELVPAGRAGLMVPPGDESALAAALVHLLGNRELAERMGAAGREVALARFSVAAATDRLIALYEQIRVPTGRALPAARPTLAGTAR